MLRPDPEGSRLTAWVATPVSEHDAESERNERRVLVIREHGVDAGLELGREADERESHPDAAVHAERRLIVLVGPEDSDAADERLRRFLEPVPAAAGNEVRVDGGF